VRPGVSGLVSDRKELVLCAGSGPDVLVNEPCGLGDPLRARPGVRRRASQGRAGADAGPRRSAAEPP